MTSNSFFSLGDRRGHTSRNFSMEGFFLAPEVLRHPPRNEQQMAEWLGHAGNVLRRAVEHREQIERLTKEHGPDAKVR